MDFNFTAEQQLLADTVQRFAREHYSFDARRRILATSEGWSRDAWQRLADLGLTALCVPEQHGGLGGNAIDALLVMSALGEALVLEPYLDAALMIPALLARLDDEQAAADLLPAIAAAQRIVILAHQEPGTRHGLHHVETRARAHRDGYRIDGHKSVIAYGDIADEWLVTVRTDGQTEDTDGISLFRIDPKAPGVTLTAYRTLDGRRAADIELVDVQVPATKLIGAQDQAYKAIEAAHETALSALCAEAVGIMKAVNAATLEYTRNRKQFGQPIASFQVLQHRMVDMFMHAEQATSMSYLAAIKCSDPDAGERRRALSAAKVVIGQAGRFIGQQAIQLHGGMGMSDEMIVSHYFKRLTAIELGFGDTDFHLQQFIAASRPS